MTAIIDYDAGNIKSVEKALKALGEDAVITRDKETLLKADRVILPGVGAFGDAMEKLNAYGLAEIIREIVKRGTPFLGICLGLQLLFESSDECPEVEGLGLLEGRIVTIPRDNGLKVPHIGWNSVSIKQKDSIFSGVDDNSYFYFVHSYYLKGAQEDVVAGITEYGVPIECAVQKGNLCAVQFHPEKSSSAGLKLLKNFIAMEG